MIDNLNLSIEPLKEENNSNINTNWLELKILLLDIPKSVVLGSINFGQREQVNRAVKKADPERWQERQAEIVIGLKAYGSIPHNRLISRGDSRKQQIDPAALLNPIARTDVSREAPVIEIQE